jgi:hypothetical protein
MHSYTEFDKDGTLACILKRILIEHFENGTPSLTEQHEHASIVEFMIKIRWFVVVTNLIACTK